MTTTLRIATRPACWLLAGISLLVSSGLSAASMAELSELSRRSTFEVVLPKVELAQITYEKPLPLELLSFTERNDKYWSIGTAFAIAPDVFVSNAHVLVSGMGSALGHPHLRDAEGKVYPVDRVLKFSLHEDFIVFRARGANAAQALTPGSQTPIGARVFAVGNALGEGVVLRDGLLTSLTPEDQDGRWKWLRFSAAASPGNSGGPLLDEQGKVIGMVTARSQGENLNYALPIEQVLAGSDRQAGIDLRSSFNLPILRQQMVMEFKDQFPLPASWEDFGRRLMVAGDRQYVASQQRLLQQYAQELPPGGKADRLLASLEDDHPLALIAQQPDDSWGLTEPDGEEMTELADGSRLTTGSLQGAFSFRWWRPGTAADASLYSDATAFMDTLLKAIKLPRMIGPQAIRITSLGAPAGQSVHTDRFGRPWQIRSWPLGYADMQLVTLALPVPNGYMGLMQFTSAMGHSSVLAELKLMADYTHVSYEGSAAQWRTFVAAKELCPPFLRDLRFAMDAGVAVSLHGMDVNLPPALLPLSDESLLAVYPGYRVVNKQLVVRPAGITLWATSEGTGSRIEISAQPKPGEAAGSELQKRWQTLNARDGQLDGRPQRDPNGASFWTNSIMGDPASDLLFEVNLTLAEKSLVPRQVSERRDQLHAGLKLLELPR
jgi:serine protease Do